MASSSKPANPTTKPPHTSEPSNPSYTITRVRTPQDLADTIILFTAYAESLNLDLSFQDFQTEMSTMPGKYSPTSGGEILLARATPAPANPNPNSNGTSSTQAATTTTTTTTSNPVPTPGEPLGCVALRSLSTDTNGPCHQVCEMKRLYVSPGARGLGLGRLLAEQIIAIAEELGYVEMRLDTLPTMDAAQGMYRALGFVDIPPYRFNPVEGTRYLGLRMGQRAGSGGASI